MLQVVEFIFMVGIDLMFIAVLILLMLPLGIYRQAAFAVMKRNFVGYFSNPTGYVFLCLFVLLTSFAAFWPHEFFTTNLANFDQLNKFLPYIMLIFIPAITMSIWSEERRQGTDELLLTLPAQDFDIVIGKYFAAVLVFTVSLFFSQLSNYAVLISMTGGDLDSGLLFATYLGYWFVGIAMLAVGMVASFLTNNLTVGFIFGAVFNAPLAFFSNADVIFSDNRWVNLFYNWSLLQRFEPFGRGLINLPSVVYYLGIVVLGVYLSLVLIGRRHWLGGRDGTSLLGHYVLRSLFLFAAVVAVVMICENSIVNRLRLDVSREKVSTLSPATLSILEDLNQNSGNADASEPITIDAYVSSNVPAEYVETKYNLLNLLREFNVLGGNRIDVNVHSGLEPFSEEAIQAEKRFGIRPVKIESQSRGARRQQDVILGCAFTSGLERIVIPFFPAGMPVEYELIRSINTVAQPQRKTIGVLQTRALPMGRRISADRMIPKLGVITELEKQYEVEAVSAEQPLSLWLTDDAGNPTRRRYDALVVIQPSTLTVTEQQNLIAAIRTGQPTAIFEDPFPYCFRNPNPGSIFVGPTPSGADRQVRRFHGTAEAKHALNTPERPICDIRRLWEALGVYVETQSFRGLVFPNVLWQLNNPYPRNRELDLKELMVLRQDRPTDQMFSNEELTTSEIRELYLPFPGHVEPNPSSPNEFIPLVNSGTAGKLSTLNLIPGFGEFINTGKLDSQDQFRGLADSEFTVAGRILGPPVENARPGGNSQINVVYVSDIDFFSDGFIVLHNMPFQNGIRYRFDNIPFFHNIIDSLAGQKSYIPIRGRRINHKTLGYVEKTTQEALEIVASNEQQYEEEFNQAVASARTEATEELEPRRKNVEQLEKRKRDGRNIPTAVIDAKKRELQAMARAEQAKLNRKIGQLRNELLEKRRQTQLDAELKIQEIQRRFKLAAVTLPVIPPLLLGLFVFTRRRLREREGISKARRLK